ncbi:MAG TPA: hypothetical protein VHD87_11980 [Acidimicrobiales bacterium]|nr:hypothetical protein [Acidimicrobiales bacterium]
MLEPDGLIEHGTHVEVKSRFDGRWARGFTVEHGNGDGYTVRREHDQVILPERFPADEVRIEKRHWLFWRH